jgi:hypothetical protein
MVPFEEIIDLLVPKFEKPTKADIIFNAVGICLKIGFAICLILLGIAIGNGIWRAKLIKDGTHHYIVDEKTGNTELVPINIKEIEYE